MYCVNRQGPAEYSGLRCQPRRGRAGIGQGVPTVGLAAGIRNCRIQRCRGDARLVKLAGCDNHLSVFKFPAKTPRASRKP